jgi:hypothetical protein
MICFCNKSFNIILKFSRNVHKLIHFSQSLWTNQNQAQKTTIDFGRPDLLHLCLVIWKSYLSPDWPRRGATLYNTRNVRWLGPTQTAMALKTPVTWTKEIILNLLLEPKIPKPKRLFWSRLGLKSTNFGINLANFGLEAFQLHKSTRS